jgi:hypothetical protein
VEYTYIPPYVYMAWCLINKAQGQLYLLLRRKRLDSARHKPLAAGLERETQILIKKSGYITVKYLDSYKNELISIQRLGSSAV